MNEVVIISDRPGPIMSVGLKKPGQPNTLGQLFFTYFVSDLAGMNDVVIMD